MSDNASLKKHAQQRTHTIIGESLRIEGAVSFTGGLRVYGQVLGNVSSPDDPHGTVTVEGTGKVIGTVTTPYIINKGQIEGAIHAAQRIEIHTGGHCTTSGAIYRELVVRTGGILNGPLNTIGLQENASANADASPSFASSSTPEPERPARPNTASGAAPHPIRNALITLAIVALLGWGWKVTQSTAPKIETSETPAKAEVSIPPLAANETTAAQKPAEPPPSAPVTNAQPVAEPPPATHSALEGAVNHVVTIQGVNPAKTADALYIVTKSPSVLFRKKRSELSSGVRVEILQGKRISMTIAKDEVFRVTEGFDIEIYFQGQKVSPKTLRSAAWINFSPVKEATPNTGTPAQ